MDGDINDDFSHDEMPIYGKAMPEVVVEAVSTEEVAAVMKLLQRASRPRHSPRRGTGLTGALSPFCGGVVLSITKMNKILSYDTDNMVVRVQAGVLLNDLAEDAAKKGFLYPPIPVRSSPPWAATCPPTPAACGRSSTATTRDYVRAMTVVLPTGEIVNMAPACPRPAPATPCST